MFRAAVLTDEFRNVDPDSFPAVSDAVTKAGTDLGFVKLDEAAFGSAKSISIDVMEKTARAAVVPVACGWSDVCSWHAVWELSSKGGDGNAARGAAVFEGSRNCEHWSRSKTSTTLWCLQATGRQLRLVAKLKMVAPQVTEDLIRVHRPWGSYQSVGNGYRHHVKRIIVKPGGRLSLQKHHDRSEHWIVVRGNGAGHRQ